MSWFYLHHLERVRVAVRHKLYRRGNQKGLPVLSCTCLSFSSSHSYSLHNWEIKHAHFNCPYSLWSSHGLLVPTCAEFRHSGPAAVPGFVYRVTIIRHTHACVISCVRVKALLARLYYVHSRHTE